MNPYCKCLFLFSCLFLSVASVSAQQLLHTLATYNKDFPEEKIHVHFDKQIYSAGETIWFKAYLRNYTFPSLNSTSLHTELIDAKGTVVQAKTFPIFQSSSAGSFELPAHLKDESLLFRAYTTWMLNLDTAFLFVKPIRLHTTAKITASTSATTLRFFPEGGHLLAGFPSTIAFKATDAYQHPVAVSGVIVESGRTVSSFKTSHDGMGQVVLEPGLHKTYYAQWKDANGVDQQVPLPTAKASGMLLEVKQSGGDVLYMLKRSDNVPASMKQVHLIGLMHQQKVYQATVNMQATDLTSGLIKGGSLTTGILQLTLFDSDWRPIAERISFINRNDFSFPAHINTSTKSLGKREKNTFELEVPDTLETNLSISITDAQLPADNEGNIFTNLLLTSDLRGYIHNPAYYLSSTADSVLQHLDMLMLTHGWRRYNWEALALGKLPELKYPKEQYLSINGKVYGASTNALAASQQLNLIIQTRDSARRFFMAPLDKEGTFSLHGLIFFDTVNVFYSFNKGDRLNRSATVQFSPAIKRAATIGISAREVINRMSRQPIPARAAFFSEKNAEVLPLIARRTITLQEVVVESKRRTREQEFDQKYASGLFQSGNSRSFNLVDDPFAASYYNVLSYLEGKVPGLQINSSGGEYSIIRRNDPPELFIDEMPATVSDINSISMTDVAYIKVFDPPFLGAFGNGPGGAIAIYRKAGSDAKRDTKGLNKGQVVGYAPIKEFYAPDYSVSSPLHEFEDIRSTLYWNPFVLTDKNNRKVKIEFYNNDVSKSLRVVVEGMNKWGQLTRVEKIIE